MDRAGGATPSVAAVAFCWNIRAKKAGLWIAVALIGCSLGTGLFFLIDYRILSGCLDSPDRQFTGGFICSLSGFLRAAWGTGIYLIGGVLIPGMGTPVIRKTGFGGLSS